MTTNMHERIGTVPNGALPRFRSADAHTETGSRQSLGIRCWSAVDRLLGQRGCFLTFHRVARTEAWSELPNRGFYLDLGFLDDLLGYLKRRDWAVVTIDEALNRRRAGDACGQFVNFSIDDVYRDTWELAVPLFRKHGVPVTLFVTTGIPDESYLMWTTGLEAILAARSEVMVREDGRRRRRRVETWDEKQDAFNELRAAWEIGDTASIYRLFCIDNEFLVADIHEAHAVTWDMLESLRDDPHVEIGAHTVSHPRVSSLAEVEALHELEESRSRIEKRLGVPVRHFAFPYGRSADCGPRDFALAREAGYASAATTCKGVVRPGGPFDPYRLPRNTLNGAHRDVLAVEAHMTGLTGFAARLLGRN